MKRNKNSDHEVDFSQIDNVREPPKPDWPAAPFTGAKWGAALGLLGSQIYMRSSEISMLGISVYPGNFGLVLGLGVGGGMLIGAFAGWASLYLPKRT